MKIGSLVELQRPTRDVEAPLGFGIVMGLDPHEHLVQVRWLDGRLRWHCAAEVRVAGA